MPWALLNHSFFCVNRIFIPHGNSPFPSNFCLFVLPSGENVKIKCVGGRGGGGGRIPFIPIQNLPLHSLNFGLPFFISGQIFPKFLTTKSTHHCVLNGQRQKRLFGQFPPLPKKKELENENVLKKCCVYNLDLDLLLDLFLFPCIVPPSFSFHFTTITKKTNHCPAAIGIVAAIFCVCCDGRPSCFLPFLPPKPNATKAQLIELHPLGGLGDKGEITDQWHSFPINHIFTQILGRELGGLILI